MNFRIKYYNIFLVVFLSLILPMTLLAQKNQEEIIVFIQTNKESDFTIREIFKLEKFLKENKIPVKVIDIERVGAPEEVKYTPLVMYQNYLGRKIYKGRYTTLNRLKNFITTVQYIPSDAGEYTVSNALVWKEGRSEFFVQSKITPLKGTIPSDFNPAEFMNQAWLGIKRAMKDFKFYNHKNFLLSNEIFYFNYYPYRGDDGRIYVSVELFSHYDCVTPVFKKTDVPIKSGDVQRAFFLAAKTLKTEMMRQWKESTMGDAVSAITDNINTVSWEKIGVIIPPPPEKEKIIELNNRAFQFAPQWDYASSYEDETPPIQFYFPPPIHQYSGFVNKIRGGIKFNHSDSFYVADMTGEFTVATSSLSMGLEDLDAEVHRKMIKIDQFPAAKFKIIKVRARKGAVIALGAPTYTQVEGEFTLMGKTLKVKAPTQFEPYVDINGEVFMHIKSSFKIEQLNENYDIEGPPGPAKSSNNIIVKINILLSSRA